MNRLRSIVFAVAELALIMALVFAVCIGLGDWVQLNKPAPFTGAALIATLAFAVRMMSKP